MTQEPICHRAYASINRPLTIWGADRRLFLLALMIGAGAFNFFGSLLLGMVMFLVLYGLARWTMAFDAQLPRVLLNSTRFHRHYDPLKLAYVVIRRLRHRD
jgi:type IV secretory pathway TrbD component